MTAAVFLCMSRLLRSKTLHVIPLRGMTAAVFLCMSKLLRSKTLHVIPGLTRNLIDEKNRLDDLPRRAFFIAECPRHVDIIVNILLTK